MSGRCCCQLLRLASSLLFFGCCFCWSIATLDAPLNMYMNNHIRRSQVAGHASLGLDTVTGIRFEFNLQAKPGRFDGEVVFFTGGTMGELGTEACNDSGQSPMRPPPPPTPTTPPPPPAPTGGGGEEDGDAPCATYPEFMAQSAAVTAAW